MWIMTKYGFFSVVCAHKNPDTGRIDGRPHSNLVMVRARDINHLESLLQAAHLSLDIKSTGGTDYPYRVVMDRETLGIIMRGLVGGIDYVNFKDAVHSTRPADTRFHKFLMDIWHLGLRLTTRDPADEPPGFFDIEDPDDTGVNIHPPKRKKKTGTKRKHPWRHHGA